MACVMNDPMPVDNRVVVINFSTLDVGKETWCVVPAGAHPFLGAPSVVMYSMSRVVLAKFIDDEIRAGRFKEKSPVSQELWDLICSGFGRARKEVPKVCLSILESRGVIAMG